jgi:4-hydroxy-2-oxoheptanedioate aldolase
VLTKLRAGELVSCVKLNLSCARVAEIAALSGFDCIWLDLEHVPNTLHEIENQIRAAKTHNVDSVVRVARGGISDVLYPLEMDAAGIMVPHCSSEREARELAQATRFHPIGRRPLDGGNADGGYCKVPLERYMRQANEQRLVIVQIEDPEALEELDAIAQVPGIDMLFFGPGDFSQGIGVPGKMDDPRLIEARRAVAAAARRFDKFAGTVATPATIADRVAEGYRFVSMGADVYGLGEYFNGIARSFEQTPVSRATKSPVAVTIHTAQAMVPQDENRLAF